MRMSEKARKSANDRPIPPPAADIDTLWFRQRLSEQGISQRKLAHDMHLDPAAVSLMLRGKRRIQTEEVPVLAKLLGVPAAEIMTRYGLDASAGAANAVALRGWIDELGEVHKNPPGGVEHVPGPLDMPKGTCALRYRTNDHRDGWIVFYVPTETMPPDPNTVCVVQLASKEKRTFIRVVKKGYSRGTYNLVGQYGEGALDGVQLVSASPVYWIKPARVG